MLEKIKQYSSYALGLAVLLVSALLFRKSKQLDNTESQLAHEKTTTEITLNDEVRKAAAANADALLDEYHKLRGDNR